MKKYLFIFSLVAAITFMYSCNNSAKKTNSSGVDVDIEDAIAQAESRRTADPEKFGKQVGGDIIANKKTFLLLKAFELAEGKNLSDLKYWIDLQEFDSKEKVEAVKAIFDNLDIQSIAKNDMDRYKNKALQIFTTIAVSDEAKSNLLELTNQLMDREY